MDIDLTRLSADNLNMLLRKAERDLHAALIDGRCWHEVKELRDYITEIKVAMYRNDYTSHNSDINDIKRRLLLNRTRFEAGED